MALEVINTPEQQSEGIVSNIEILSEPDKQQVHKTDDPLYGFIKVSEATGSKPKLKGSRDPLSDKYDIGYGFTELLDVKLKGSKVNSTTTITAPEAETQLERQLNKRRARVDKQIPNEVKSNPNYERLKDMLVSTDYNAGNLKYAAPNSFKRLISGDVVGAIEGIYHHEHGIVNSRPDGGAKVQSLGLINRRNNELRYLVGEGDGLAWAKDMDKAVYENERLLSKAKELFTSS